MGLAHLLGSGQFRLPFPVDGVLDALLGICFCGILCIIGMVWCIRFRMRLRIRVGLALGFGIGASLFAAGMELPGILGFLNFYTVLGVLLGIGALAFLPWARWLKSTEGNPAQDTELDIRDLSTHQKGVFWACFTIIGLISLFQFIHAVLYPVVYWDALPHYVNFGRWTFQEGRFPEKVVAQVAGLSANYPHLFTVLESGPAFLLGRWGSRFGQVLPPLMGILTSILVYRTIMETWRDRLTGIFGTLFFSAVPYGIVYFINESAYCAGMLYSALFLYLSGRFFRNPKTETLALLGMVCIGAAKVNFLMPILSVFFVGIYLWGIRKERLAGKRRGLVTVGVCLLLASSWYVRNWIVTGNPIYPFFPNLLGGKYIDPRILASCEIEWLKNGDGIGRFSPHLWGRFLALPQFFALNQPNFHWKFQPLLVGLWLPSLVLFGLSLFRRTPNSDDRRTRPLLTLSFTIAFFFLFYHIVLSPFYAYHLTPFFPALAVGSSLALRRLLDRGIRLVSYPVLLLLGLVPGLSMAIMGPKFMSPHLSAMNLRLHEMLETNIPDHEYRKSLGIPLSDYRFLHLKFPDAVPVWEDLHEIRASSSEPVRILTHENRYLYLPEGIEIVHLDDWDISRLFGQPWPTVREFLRENGIRYYLRTPNEMNHPILRELNLGIGMDREDAWKGLPTEDWIRKEITQGNILFELKEKGQN